MDQILPLEPVRSFTGSLLFCTLFSGIGLADAWHRSERYCALLLKHRFHESCGKPLPGTIAGCGLLNLSSLLFLRREGRIFFFFS